MTIETKTKSTELLPGSIRNTRRRFLKNTAGGVFALTLADLIAPPLQKARAQMGGHYY